MHSLDLGKVWEQKTLFFLFQRIIEKNLPSNKKNYIVVCGQSDGV